MTNTSLFDQAMELANEAWGIQPVQKVRMPVLENQRTVVTAEVDALWTDGGLRPNASNLAFLMQRVSNSELEQWKHRLKTLPVRASLLVTPDELYLLQSSLSSLGDSEPESLNLDTWRETLVSPKSHLFKPQELAKRKSGQLSLADLEETFSEGSFNSLLREQQREIDQAFLQGIQEALQFVETSQDSGSSRAEAKGHVIRFAIAYLAARILEDKNFFDARIEDPIELLDRIGKIRNGFFKRAKASADYVPLEARQALTRHMGYQVSFVLADHRDVGRLYEKAIKSLKEQDEELDNENWGDLKQHYTPVAIAERMLEALPLERLRPSERVIFDPAAGSGSLLLAATSRLAAMTDIPSTERSSYLRTHVIGNDWDDYASWIAQLRYFLASESLGNSSDSYKLSEVLPFPENFTNLNYNGIENEIFPIKPRVIVANPPFEEKDGIQEAASFVDKVLSWMKDGSQFAFVLPQSFLASTTHGVSEARNLINQRCHILETWKLPEGGIGTDARQSTCIVIGIVGKPKTQVPTISRAIVSSARINDMRENGFLGKSWISQLTFPTKDWSVFTAPPIDLQIPTIPLGNLFFVFNGVTHQKAFPPVAACPAGRECKPTWRMRWSKSSIWADPLNVDQKMRWVIYEKELLHRAAIDVKDLFDLPKILIGRISNPNAKKTISVQLDTTGFCPNNSVWCVLPVKEARKFNKGFSPALEPQGWSDLSFEQQRFWLLGILVSETGAALSMLGRSSVNLTANIVCQFRLPLTVDHRIIQVVAQMIEMERSRNKTDEFDSLYQQLNDLVIATYGYPSLTTIQRTGITSELEDWEKEQKIQTKTTIGQVLGLAVNNNQVRMYISRLMDDDDTEGEWIPLPQNLPGWALDGTPFEAELSYDIETFEQLRERPWALRKFRHTPRPYLTDQELDEFLRIPELEAPV